MIAEMREVEGVGGDSDMLLGRLIVKSLAEPRAGNSMFLSTLTL